MDERLKHMPPKHRELLQVLKPGSDQALNSRELMRLIGVKSDSEIRELIHQLVEVYGIPIAGSNDPTKPGYYLISSEEERDSAARNLTSRIKSMSKRLKVVNHSAYFFEGEEFVPANKEQLRLF